MNGTNLLGLLLILLGYLVGAVSAQAALPGSRLSRAPHQLVAGGLVLAGISLMFLADPDAGWPARILFAAGALTIAGSMLLKERAASIMFMIGLAALGAGFAWGAVNERLAEGNELTALDVAGGVVLAALAAAGWMDRRNRRQRPNTPAGIDA